ncbi:hypothetical protein [Nitrosopumilus sp.]|uniref:hypothetical protein n=1 Tax=Nitrosopumilus sp. TaxID=2024843 RepID=UPI0026197E0E|nr:hypothetical protein [Nitrosopumilus sp.]
MTNSVFGQVIGVRKFSNDDIEVDFYHEDEVSTYRYSSDPSRLGNFPKNLIESLCSVLATEICVEIFFDDSGNPSHIEMEECDDEEEDDEEFDEDYVSEES